MPITVFPSVDFPQPLSPPRPSVPPGHTVKDTPSTARSQPIRRPNALRTGKCRTRSTTSSRDDVGAVAAWITPLSRGAYRTVVVTDDDRMVAAHAVVAPEALRLRPAGAALRRRVVAARVEPAARGRIDEARHLARDVPDLGVRARQTLQQPPRVRVRGPAKEVAGWRRLHLLPGVHDDDPVADLVRGAEVVGREEGGHAALLHELAQQAEDLRLDRHVQGRGGLVGDDQIGPRPERHGDHESLPLASRELVG